MKIRNGYRANFNIPFDDIKRAYIKIFSDTDIENVKSCIC